MSGSLMEASAPVKSASSQGVAFTPCERHALERNAQGHVVDHTEDCAACRITSVQRVSVEASGWQRRIHWAPCSEHALSGPPDERQFHDTCPNCVLLDFQEYHPNPIRRMARKLRTR